MKLTHGPQGEAKKDTYYNRFTIDSDDELKRRLMALDADVTFSDRVEQPSVEHIFTVRWKVILNQSAAARAERQALDVLPLRYDGTD